MSVLNGFLDNVVAEIVNPIILLLSALAFMFMVWGIFKFISNAADATKRKEGRDAILWGLVGIIIIFGAYGIINVVLKTFSLGEINQEGEFNPE